MKKLAVYLAAFALPLLVLSGCSNMFLEKPGEYSGGGDSTGIPEGFGTVQVNLTRGAARTIMPIIELGSLDLEYLFSKDGGTAEEKTPNVYGQFTLEPGEYSLTVNGYVDNTRVDLAVQGTTDATFTITAGSAAGPVNVNLHPRASGEGTGTLEFRLKYPLGVTVETLKLTLLAGDDYVDLLEDLGPPSPTGFNGTKTGIPVGYYLLQVKLENSGVSTGRREVVHIYKNLTARAEYDFIADDFEAIRVTSAANTGAGTLREAITTAMAATEPQVIQVMLAPGTEIKLESILSTITKSLTIEGNGVILTRAASWTSEHNTTQLLRIGAYTEVQIRRMHFKDSVATYEGGAIIGGGNLTLESCIFSGNRTTDLSPRESSGGAIHSGGTLTLRGCTFYGNTSSYRGGAVTFEGSTLTLTGNLFYGNTAGVSYPVVFNSRNGTISASYNVVDAAFGTGTTQAGWIAGTGDTTTSALPILPLSFKLLAGRAAEGKLPAALPADYPVKDFYGNPISGGGAAGAVQESTAPGYYYLVHSVNNNLGGSVTVSTLPDTDGLYPADTIITANSSTGYNFGYWLVNGIKTDTGTETVSLSDHSIVQAVFTRTVTVTDFTSGAGTAAAPTLRYALTNAQDGDIITLDKDTAGTTVIELGSALPNITKRLTIEGNGVTLTRAASWTASSATTQLLRITGTTAEVVIRGMLFKNGLATSDGGAIYNTGILTLESCIFSGNQVTGNSATSGALYSNNSLTIRGCTFYGNTASSAGVVYFNASEKTLTLTGNLFYRNTAPLGYPVIRSIGTVNASYNVVDVALGTGPAQAGWSAATGNMTISGSGLPVSPLSFKLLDGSGARDKLPSDLPDDYPDTDFYGNPISGGGAAGAVQASTANASGYYYLDLSVNNSQGGSATVTTSPDADGLYPAGSVSITASVNSGYTFGYWLVDGVKNYTTPLALTLSAHTWVEAVFNRTITVNTSGETGGGTLRDALTNAQDGDVITFSGVTKIELTSPLEITKSLTIEGEGAILTRAPTWTTSDPTTQLLRIAVPTAEVVIRRMHFKDGKATAYGGAIRNDGTLTLESCILSGNQITDNNVYSGAIHSANTLTLRGCTFYGNTAGPGGAAVYFSASGKTLTLTGNLFYGNTATHYPVVYKGSSAVDASYNAVDAAFGTGDAQAGWGQGTGDTTISSLPVSGTTFKLLAGSAAGSLLPGTLPAGYPSTDFYGDTISGEGAAGAVQGTVTGAGVYYLDYSVNNSERGTVTVSPIPDVDGLYPAGSVSITASVNTGYAFGYWLVDGVKNYTTPLTLTLSAHTRVQAVFNRIVTVNMPYDDNMGGGMSGTLRYALTNAEDGDVITLSGVTEIELRSALPITKSLTIEGNGVTLTPSTNWTSSSTSQLLVINDSDDNNTVDVVVRGVHFKDGLATTNGGAINNGESLTLESCIFSGNRTTSTGAYGGGGALYSTNTLTIRGCTFYGNTSSRDGGAVYFNASGKTLTLTGNLFYGNTGVSGYPVVYNNNGTVTASYNVVDVLFGYGWTAGTGTITASFLSISPLSFRFLTGREGEFKRLATDLPTDYPINDFYGAPISGAWISGAVQASTASGYYYLDYSVNNSARGSVSVPATPGPDADGVYAAGTNVTATPNPGYYLAYWLVNGEKDYTNLLSLSAHSQVQAVFHRAVTQFTDGPGTSAAPTLRYALTNAEDGDIIKFSGGGLSETIRLESALPEITKSLTIEGGSVTLTPDDSWTERDSTSQLLRITTNTAEVVIRRMHFKDGHGSSTGGAIYNNGILTLESCIFSDNVQQQDGGWGAAIGSYNTLTIRGCTFSGNTAGTEGGAVYFSASGKTLTLTGNLFYNNHEGSQYPVVGNISGTVSASYNVVDVPFGTESAQAGWTAGTGDKTFAEVGIATGNSPFDILPELFVPVSALSGVLPSTRPEDFPTTDFYGTTRTFPGAPGAVAMSPF